MYLLVVVVSLLLNSVPAQSRPVEVRTDKIEMENYIISSSSFLLGAQVDGPLITFGDIAVSTGFKNADPCTARGCKWERSTDGLVYVPYVISKKYTPDELQVIKQGLQSFAGVSCIRFVPHEGQRHFLYIMSDSGCYSYLGRQGGGQVVSLQRHGCVYHRTVQHELLHALGLLLFLYVCGFRKAFSRNNEATMIPIPDKKVVIGEARSMSCNDILRINRLYCISNDFSHSIF
uniref:Nephrosin n=1 Tax=Cyprinus carpio TaxID=7962 RepID=A0A8C2AI17_CYPCA